MRKILLLLLLTLGSCSAEAQIYKHTTEVKLETVTLGIAAPGTQILIRDISDGNKMKYIPLSSIASAPDLTPYTKTDGSALPTGNWDFNLQSIDNINKVNWRRVSGDEEIMYSGIVDVGATEQFRMQGIRTGESPSLSPILIYDFDTKKWTIDDEEIKTTGDGLGPDGSVGDGTVSGSGSIFTVNNGAINSAKVADGSLTGTDILAGSIDNVDLVPNSILGATLKRTNLTLGAGEDEYVPTFDNATGGFTFVDPATLGGGGGVTAYNDLTGEPFSSSVSGGHLYAPNLLFFNQLAVRNKSLAFPSPSTSVNIQSTEDPANLGNYYGYIGLSNEDTTGSDRITNNPSSYSLLGDNNNVSIGGSTAPTEKLEVNGNVLSNGFKIPAGTSDGVLLANGGTASLAAITGTDNQTLSLGGTEGKVLTISGGNAVTVPTLANSDQSISAERKITIQPSQQLIIEESDGTPLARFYNTGATPYFEQGIRINSPPAYGPSWNGSNIAPNLDVIYDQLETMAGTDSTLEAQLSDNNAATVTNAEDIVNLTAAFNTVPSSVIDTDLKTSNYTFVADDAKDDRVILLDYDNETATIPQNIFVVGNYIRIKNGTSGLANIVGGAGVTFPSLTLYKPNQSVTLKMSTTNVWEVEDGYSLSQIDWIPFVLSTIDGELTTGTNKSYCDVPFAFRVVAVKAGVFVAPSGSNVIIDVNVNGATVLPTKITIDATEKHTKTAAAPAVITATSFVADSYITIDIDQIGSTNPGEGGIVYVGIIRL